MRRLGQHSHPLTPGWQPDPGCTACQAIAAGQAARDAVRNFNVTATVVASVAGRSGDDAATHLAAMLRAHGFEIYVQDQPDPALAPFPTDEPPTGLYRGCVTQQEG
jgi:hypothetical protein